MNNDIIDNDEGFNVLNLFTELKELVAEQKKTLDEIERNINHAKLAAECGEVNPYDSNDLRRINISLNRDRLPLHYAINYLGKSPDSKSGLFISEKNFQYLYKRLFGSKPINLREQEDKNGDTPLLLLTRELIKGFPFVVKNAPNYTIALFTCLIIQDIENSIQDFDFYRSIKKVLTSIIDNDSINTTHYHTVQDEIKNYNDKNQSDLLLLTSICPFDKWNQFGHSIKKSILIIALMNSCLKASYSCIMNKETDFRNTSDLSPLLLKNQKTGDSVLSLLVESSLLLSKTPFSREIKRNFQIIAKNDVLVSTRLKEMTVELCSSLVSGKSTPNSFLDNIVSLVDFCYQDWLENSLYELVPLTLLIETCRKMAEFEVNRPKLIGSLQWDLILQILSKRLDNSNNPDMNDIDELLAFCYSEFTPGTDSDIPGMIINYSLINKAIEKKFYTAIYYFLNIIPKSKCDLGSYVFTWFKLAIEKNDMEVISILLPLLEHANGQAIIGLALNSQNKKIIGLLQEAVLGKSESRLALVKPSLSPTLPLDSKPLFKLQRMRQSEIERVGSPSSNSGSSSGSANSTTSSPLLGS